MLVTNQLQTLLGLWFKVVSGIPGKEYFLHHSHLGIAEESL
jgi:hypothetical protein